MDTVVTLSDSMNLTPPSFRKELNVARGSKYDVSVLDFLELVRKLDDGLL